MKRTVMMSKIENRFRNETALHPDARAVYFNFPFVSDDEARADGTSLQVLKEQHTMRKLLAHQLEEALASGVVAELRTAIEMGRGQVDVDMAERLLAVRSGLAAR